MDKLNVSEKFYSLQMEGATTGVPAYFIRLRGCSLSCGFSKEALSKFNTYLKENPEERMGGNDHKFADLYQSGSASWCCDTISVWLRGKLTPFEDVIDDWKQLGILESIKTRQVHIVFTGGEPTMLNHQRDIVAFVTYLLYKHNIDAYVEIETNGAIPITPQLYEVLNQINCSPKLANSGMEKSRRIIPDAIYSIQDHWNHWFKFVVSKEEDVQEAINDFIQPFNINPRKVLLMPGLDKQEDFHERTYFVAEMAKKYRYRATTRLHISSWKNVTGC